MWRDNDKPGEKWQERVVTALRGAGARVGIVPVDIWFADKSDGYDAADVLAEGKVEPAALITSLMGCTTTEAEVGARQASLSNDGRKTISWRSSRSRS